jgi:two-component system response regulator CpxR
MGWCEITPARVVTRIAFSGKNRTRAAVCVCLPIGHAIDGTDYPCLERSAESRLDSPRYTKSEEGVCPCIMRPKKMILCVDDNENELSVLKFMLSTNGYRVVSANSGSEAIGIFADTTPDLVLSDYAMPQMNGDQLVNRLKQIAAHVPMILLGDPQKMGDQLHGADALLAKKTCSPQELLERIKTMSARKRGPRKGGPRMGTPQLAVAS